MAAAAPINFVHPDAHKWRDWSERTTPPDPDEAPERFCMGRDHTLTQVFFRLKRRGLPVRLSDRFASAMINVAHCDDLDAWRQPVSAFVVAIQNDRFAPSLCELCVVPNPLLAASPRDVYLPCYTQTGLIPRDADRDAHIERVAYFGIEKNLAPEFRSETFRAALAQRGLRFELRQRDWHDYRAVDVILAVRTDYNPQFLRHKLPLKLHNAWMARVPALLGPEPAYQHARRSELDYIEVCTPSEALAAIDRLRAEPDLYRAMVQNAEQRSAPLAHDRVTDAWRDYLFDTAAAAFERWRSGGRILCWPQRAARFLWRAVRHHADRKRWWNERWWRTPAPQ
ncbi:MAG: hypothetical protein D6744_03190 [Planctomycetota bacterium]|nr:MAG: hypothetical protein D6744_03190 [Planctomycetota bacterium]